jgi:structural maintenance of chromosome 4
MGLKRKRQLKRRLVDSDDEEDTFINNSDFVPDQPNNEDTDEGKLFNEASKENGAENESSIHNGSVSKHEDDLVYDEFVDADSKIANDASKDHDVKPVNGANGTLGQENNVILNQVDLLPPPPTVKEVQEEVANGSGLSYSQQQATIQLQSPSKRKDNSSQTSAKPNEPRLVIDKLVLTNFKSYAGVQVIGPFNASFSAVVGPNGSGKSNVIDSMLFVFGFRALKMRQGKLSELIHNSAGGNKLDYCQVDIHFNHVLDSPEDNAKSEVIENSELIISRKAFKNNSSQYFLNGKASNYSDVTSFLRDKGIDLDHKRFLILQGEVESIAQMKAKAERENDDGLLEYLEDIIGTTKYKQLIEENLTKVHELNDVCLEKENRLDLVEKDKELLEDKKVEALRFLEMEKKLISKKSIQYQASIIENKKVLHENQDIVNDLIAKLEEEKNSNKELGEGIKEYTKQHDYMVKYISKLNDQINSITKKQKQINKANVAIDEKIKNLSNKSKKILKSKESLEKIETTCQQKLESNSKALIQSKNELDDLTNELDVEKNKLDEIRMKLTDKTADFTKQIESLQTKLEPWNDKLKDKESAIQLMNSSIEMLQSQKQSISKQLDDSKEKLIQIKTEGKQKEAELHEAESKLSHIISQIGIGEEQCKHEKKQLELRKSQVATYRQRTQDSMNSLSTYQNKNKVLSSLMRLVKSGRIEGFYGRLGDLGVIDDRYDIAISTACPALDSMVVETVETAQTCIDYLRKNKLGYANFICLNKLRKFNLAPIQTPGNPATVKRLFDLIIPQDSKFLPAFYSKVFNTLVASDLKEAKKVAYGAKRFKVVTLDGKVVDTSGTMSGGGAYFAKGAMRLSSSAPSSDAMDISPDDVEQMKEDLATMENKFELDSREFQEKMQNLRQLKDMRPDIEFSISRLKLDIDALTSEKKEVLKVCKALIAESENDNNSKQFDKQIEEKQREMLILVEGKQELKSNMIDLESQIKALEEKIMNAGGVELRLQNSKVDSIKQKIEIINERTSNDRMAIRKLENDIKRHNKIIEESKKELEETEKELAEIQSQQQDSVLEALTSEIKEIEGEKEEKEESLENIKLELEERAQQINAFKSTEIEIENKVEKHNSIIRKAQHHVNKDEESLQGLIIRDVTPYIDWLDGSEQAKYNGAIIEEVNEDSLLTLNMNEVEDEIEELDKYMSTVKVDIEVLKEYGSKKSEFESRRSDLNTAVEERDEIKSYCEDLKRKRLDEFMEGFNTISMTLKEMYQMITMGGNAELELVDSLDPFSEGILFSVMPPKKSWKNISNLSGGEKTLSSLALVFALHRYKPTPLYVMDEIDAALDFRNVSIVANYIKERTKNAQFVVISLRNNMFELAQQLVGIYKVNNMTRSISLQNKDFLVNVK